MSTFTDIWLPYIYLYGVGGVFFFSGMYLITKTKALNTEKKQHRFWLKALYGGFFFFMILHGFMIISALYF
ncbi:MAG: hypothetical protein HND40_04875 [Ignavibacteriota bacterium]|jgi:hypothetical protein|nr:hypothetical protein [Ignavibacteriota bacterium]MBW7841225.1 hypothetical protein [Ignavibacterium sp.]MCO6448740.1 hypothetical protein [Ignavibacterium album]MCZ2268055.1 hypothetical protein [Ignavibacteriales bacterium]MDX9712619.1 hypothetical protein [Ignavibacteriaceae bacterium]